MKAQVKFQTNIATFLPDTYGKHVQYRSPLYPANQHDDAWKYIKFNAAMQHCSMSRTLQRQKVSAGERFFTLYDGQKRYHETTVVARKK